jgi:hypothetical protein
MIGRMAEVVMKKLVISSQDYKTTRIRIIRYIILSLVILFLMIVHIWVFPPLKLFYILHQGAPWPEREFGIPAEAYSLSHTKQAACFLLNHSEAERRRIIVVYLSHTNAFLPLGDASDRLYLLLRVLFDLPQEYPAREAKSFAAYIVLGGPHPYDPDKESVNLLWPLGYQDGKLVLTNQTVGYIGPPYEGLDEYDYFAARFPLRSREELDCFWRTRSN